MYPRAETEGLRTQIPVLGSFPEEKSKRASGGSNWFVALLLKQKQKNATPFTPGVLTEALPLSRRIQCIPLRATTCMMALFPPREDRRGSKPKIVPPDPRKICALACGTFSEPSGKRVRKRAT